MILDRGKAAVVLEGNLAAEDHVSGRVAGEGAFGASAHDDIIFHLPPTHGGGIGEVEKNFGGRGPSAHELWRLRAEAKARVRMEFIGASTCRGFAVGRDTPHGLRHHPGYNLPNPHGLPNPRVPGSKPPPLNPMLFTIAIILLILWGLGLVTGTAVGGFIHILLVIAIIMVLVRVIQGRRIT